VIPWWIAEEAYKTYSHRNGTGQSLERLAERGGFGREELLELLRSPPPGDSGLRQMERAYSMLKIEGVSRERARSVANGISVLATRWRREVASLEQALGALTKQVRDLATAAAGCGCTEGVAEKSRAILAEIGEMP